MDRELLHALLENIGDAVLAIDRERRFLIVNEAARALFALDARPGAPLPEDWAVLHRALDEDGLPLPSSQGALVRALHGHATDHLRFSLQRESAETPTWLEACGRPIRDATGAVVGAVAVYRDIGALRGTIEAARHAERLLRATLASIPNAAVFLVDREQRYVAADGPILEAMLRRLGVADVVGKTVAEVSDPAHRVANTQLFARTLAGEAVRIESRRGDTTYEVSTVPIRSEGAVTHALLFAYDVSQRERDRALLDATLANIEDGVALLDENRRALLANRAYLAMFDLTSARLATMARGDFIDHVAAMAADPDDFRARFEQQAGDSMDFELARPRRRILRRTWTPIAGGGARYLVTWHDVTTAADLLSEREKQTMLDPLTGIANRRFADRTLAREIDRMTTTSELSIALVDVDQFKRVNDTYGHNTGDAVLQRVARVLTESARGSDIVARWGGEEFIAILPVGLAGARVFAERLRIALAAAAPGDQPQVTVSVGLAEVGVGEAPVAAIARADARLYEAKQRGRNRVEG